MKLSPKAKNIYIQVDAETTKLGDLRNIAKAIKKDHELAIELWNTNEFLPMHLAILIMGPKLLTQEVIDKLDQDIRQHETEDGLQLMDLLMANQLSKEKRTIALMQSWKDSSSSLQRRVFWYYQARLRWVGQTPPPDSAELLDLIEKRIQKEKSEVQWAMNFTAAQIGIFQPEYRNRCIMLGEQTSLYKDEVVARGCTPNYLPN